MIIKCVHGNDPYERYYYVALRYESKTDVWTSLPGPLNVCFDQFEAAFDCLGHLQTLLDSVDLQSRALRSLCEHPSFEFDFDGIDSKTVQHHTRKLAEATELAAFEIKQMLSVPQPGDTVRVGKSQAEVASAVYLILQSSELDNDKTMAAEQFSVKSVAGIPIHLLNDMLEGVMNAFASQTPATDKSQLYDLAIDQIRILKQDVIASAPHPIYRKDRIRVTPDDDDDFRAEETGEYPSAEESES